MQTDSKNPTDTLSDGTMVKAIAAVIESFDTEFTRLTNQDEAIKILTVFQNLHHTSNLYSFFVPVSLQERSSYILTDTLLRSFMLNYTERVSMNFAARQLSYDNDFIDLLTRHITLTKSDPQSQYSLINKEVLDSLYVNPDVLKSLLKDNFWLAVLYLLLVNFQLSTVFQTASKVV